MGYQKDQRLPSERAGGEDEEVPPPAYTPTVLPGSPSPELRIHANTQAAGSSERLSAPDARYEKSSSAYSSRDPRNTSTDSLVPQTNRDGRRKLLLIYIHGFMGDETSFQSFPAHVHHLATELMSKTHIVHTKIYPKYKSRRAIEFARDEFSAWLRPHESSHTDVVLLGHSMGGILSAEVVLKPSSSAQSGLFDHRILGTINFDVPFLGLHPGVIASGLGSLFRPADKSTELETVTLQGDPSAMSAEVDGLESPASRADIANRTASPRSGAQSPASSNQASRSMSQLSIPMDDPNYNPQFENDVVRPVRKGWESALYFINKHSGGLRQAAKAYVTSHVEFGGTMADYPKLHARYKKIRALEDMHEVHRTRFNNSGTHRVRFVNLYTASTGIQSKSKNRTAPGDTRANKPNLQELSPTPEEYDLTSGISVDSDHPAVPKISTRNSEKWENMSEKDINQAEHIEPLEPSLSKSDEEHLSNIDPKAEEDAIQDSTNNQLSNLELEDLPPIPSEPIKPPDFDPTAYHDKDVLKIAQKDHSRKMKAYQSAVKDREKAITDRQKMLEKRQKKAAKEEEKALKEKQKAAKEEAKAAEKAAKLKEKQENKAVTTLAESEQEKSSAKHQSETTEQEKSKATSKEKKIRDRKFCITPSKQNGMMDPTWVRVFMEGVDEVGAHCGLFFEDKPHYEELVNDVGKIIQEWVASCNAIGDNYFTATCCWPE